MKIDENKIKQLIDDNVSLSLSPFVDTDNKKDHVTTAILLQELLERRKKDCDHEIIDITNEVITGGFMCIHCRKIFTAANIETARKVLNENITQPA